MRNKERTNNSFSPVYKKHFVLLKKVCVLLKHKLFFLCFNIRKAHTHLKIDSFFFVVLVKDVFFLFKNGHTVQNQNVFSDVLFFYITSWFSLVLFPVSSRGLQTTGFLSLSLITFPWFKLSLTKYKLVFVFVLQSRGAGLFFPTCY